MKTRLIFILVLVLSITLTSCTNPFLPVYEKTDQDGISVYIDGVRYKELPKIKWYVNPGGRTIGYAGDKYILISQGLEDPDRNFVFIKGYLADYYDCMLYRTDKTIPEPSADVVDKIMWIEYLVGGKEEYTHTTEDKDTIKELFEVLDTGNKITKYSMINKNSEIMIMYIGYYSSLLPGARYRLDIGISDGKLICGDRNENKYVEIPIDLLQKIAGKKIDVSEFTEG